MGGSDCNKPAVGANSYSDYKNVSYPECYVPLSLKYRYID